MSAWSLSAITTEMAVAAACAVVAGFAFFIWLPRRRGLEGRAQAVEGKGRGVPEDSFVSQLVTRLVCVRFFFRSFQFVHTETQENQQCV